MLIDTHCHLDFPQFDNDRETVIQRAKDNQIDYLINVGSSIESSFRARDLAEKFDNIFFSFGLHPHYADKFDKDTLNSTKDAGKLEDLLKSKKLVAIGEVGLDYYRNLSEKEKQKQVFREFIGLAKRLNLPLVIHCRESQSDTYGILHDELKNFSRIVFHCFSGPEDFLDKCLEQNAMFSFAANITYPKAVKLKELAKKIPWEKIMLETDSPFLAPQKFRGQRNEPSYVHFVAQELALIKNVTLQEISDITTQNAKRFFKLDEN
ncbi:MAG: TatD family hydrolase [Candidatus Omnitrophica bacterium]|nr:TatD family hydrolase [Candidatus Omnitrophota bacterium]MDD5351942.1 TatD family hydrolase [Candidatus Omnitrophota bacterium]MDD5550768.1 TatD family hydrolase [Candidatus Omnitrophota bacterium]